MYSTQADDVLTNVTEHADPWEDVPEYTLAVRVMVQAILDATYEPTRRQSSGPQGYRNAYGGPEQRSEAMQWLQSDDPRPLSARWIAELLGLDIHSLRQRVEQEPR